MGNHADKRAAAAAHNARYAEREAVRPKLTKPKSSRAEAKKELPVDGKLTFKQFISQCPFMRLFDEWIAFFSRKKLIGR